MNALRAERFTRKPPPRPAIFCRRFTEADALALMEVVLNSVRPQPWAGRQVYLLGPVAYVDPDRSSRAPTAAEHKAGMDMSYKGIWGYVPPTSIVSLR